MIQTRMKSNRGPSGVAQVRVMSKHVKVMLDGDEYSFNKDPKEVPEQLLNAPISKKSDAFPAAVTISKSGDRLFNVRPSDGSHIVTFKKFTHKKDSPPIPKSIPYKFITTDKGGFPIDAHQECTAIFEIVAGKFEGMELIYNMWYLWEDDGTGVALLEGYPKRVNENIDFLRLAGLDMEEDVVPYNPESVLSYLQDLLLGYATQFTANLDGKGWIDSISSLPDGLSVAPKKKTTKKKTK